MYRRCLLLAFSFLLSVYFSVSVSVLQTSLRKISNFSFYCISFPCLYLFRFYIYVSKFSVRKNFWSLFCYFSFFIFFGNLCLRYLASLCFANPLEKSSILRLSFFISIAIVPNTIHTILRVFISFYQIFWSLFLLFLSLFSLGIYAYGIFQVCVLQTLL
jgi:hypothetical protein